MSGGATEVGWMIKESGIVPSPDGDGRSLSRHGVGAAKESSDPALDRLLRLER